ncbi:MAG: C39 family peptidase [Myxococcota bacterium]
MRSQPTDSTCGPTCLHAVYAHYGDRISLNRVIKEVQPLPEGGTLAVLLANHALARGYRCTLNTYNLQIFDPTWFQDKKIDIAERLRAQAKAKRKPKLQLATQWYLEFLARGGELRYRKLTGALLRSYLKKDVPVLTGLSATYLYGCARELADKYDDVRGFPVGHFVVLAGYQSRARKILIADPLKDNPRFGSKQYSVGMERLLGAILLGIVTYDANLLVIEPK